MRNCCCSCQYECFHCYSRCGSCDYFFCLKIYWILKMSHFSCVFLLGYFYDKQTFQQFYFFITFLKLYDALVIQGVFSESLFLIARRSSESNVRRGWRWPCYVNWAHELSHDSGFMSEICLLFWIVAAAAAAVGPAAGCEPVGLRRVEQCVLIVPPSCQLKSLCELMWCRQTDVCKVCLQRCGWVPSSQSPPNVLICQGLALDAAVECAAGGLHLARQTLWFAQSQWWLLPSTSRAPQSSACVCV